MGLLKHDILVEHVHIYVCSLALAENVTDIETLSIFIIYFSIVYYCLPLNFVLILTFIYILTGSFITLSFQNPDHR